ncbi:hypothetical protein [Mesobacillus jeotgali]|uniref:hypothetical protein n=1 Tax=Mesobacillus jeotgali TaxID=129985 RepID=UPI0009A7E8E1|nr:hypothetical protein [Mesobacillus jeotgali]
MTTFLLLLSLILNAAAIFAIILLYLRQNRLVEAEKKQGKIISEIEEIFSSYLFELKEENDKFLELMANTDLRAKTSQVKSSDDAVGTHMDEEAGIKSQENRLGKGISYQAARQAYKKNSETAAIASVETKETEMESILPEDPGPEARELSIIDQVVSMKTQGLTTEEIARKLDKGKTEIELLLKFRQNTQE